MIYYDAIHVVFVYLFIHHQGESQKVNSNVHGVASFTKENLHIKFYYLCVCIYRERERER